MTVAHDVRYRHRAAGFSLLSANVARHCDKLCLCLAWFCAFFGPGNGKSPFAVFGVNKHEGTFIVLVFACQNLGFVRTAATNQKAGGIPDQYGAGGLDKVADFLRTPATFTRKGGGISYGKGVGVHETIAGGASRGGAASGGLTYRGAGRVPSTKGQLGR